MPLIEVQKVSVAYGTPQRPVLNRVDLEIDEGDFVCLLGQTGCGKSTLLRLVLGSERPQSGRILIDAVEHERPDRTRGYVPQKYSLFPDKTVLENITFGPRVSEFNILTQFSPRYFRRRKELAGEALEYLTRIGLRASDANKYPDQLSGGMQQRVAIAQALINRPRILLMDEAFSALDPGTRRDMQRLVRQLWRETGITILFVTHDTREALQLGTRVVVLGNNGHPERGSEVVHDLRVPQPCTEADVPYLISQLEAASGSARTSESEQVAAAF